MSESARSARSSDTMLLALASRVIMQAAEIEGLAARRAEAEGALRVSESRLRSVTESAADAIITADGRGAILSWNRGARAIFGYAEDEVIGQPLTMLMPQRFRAAHDEALARVTATGVARLAGRTLELMGLRAGGDEFPIELSLSAWVGDAGIHYTGIVRDITERKQAEVLLRESEERLRAVYGALACGVMVIDGRGVVVEANAAAQHLLGVTRHALLGHALAEATGPSTHEDGTPLPCAERPTGRALATGQPVRDIVFGLTRLDGARRWVRADAVPLRDEHGVVRQVVTSFIDVTGRVAAEATVRRANRALATVGACHQALVRATTEGELLEQVCRAIVTVGGYHIAWVGYADHDAARTVRPVARAGDAAYLDTVAISWADTTTGRGPTGTAIRTRRPSVVQNVTTDPAYARWRDVARARGYASSIALPLIGEGHVLGALNIYAVEPDAFDAEEERLLSGLADDVAHGLVALRARDERERAEAALRESEERFRALSEHGSDLICILAPDGTARYGSPSYERVLGAPLGDLHRLAGSPLDAIHPDDRAQVRAAVVACVRDGLPTLTLTCRHRHADRSWRTLECVATNRLDDPAIRGIIVTSRDVTARARAEAALEESRRELERSNAELAQFAYIASHDLQEPLRTITSYLQLLSRRYKGKLGEDADEFIGFATDGARRMQALIKAVLDYSRVGTRGKEFAPVDCAALVEGAIANLYATVADSGARITYDALPTVWGDDGQLGQLFQNIIGNALKFCQDTPTVHITAAPEGRWWLLRVCDNGIGIAPEQAERIFQMFQRLHTRAEYEGTGIGLATCRRIVERHGGRIWVESQPGQGATFLFTLPAIPADSRAA